MSEHSADIARVHRIIVDAARGRLDWEGPPFNIPDDEAQRDYERLADAILNELAAKGLTVIHNDGSTSGERLEP